MFGRKSRGRGNNTTRKAPGTGMKAKTRMARAANKAGIGLKPIASPPSVSAPSQKTKLQKKVASADRAQARAKAVAAGRPPTKTAAQKAMAQKRQASALKRKQAMQARKKLK